MLVCTETALEKSTLRILSALKTGLETACRSCSIAGVLNDLHGDSAGGTAPGVTYYSTATYSIPRIDMHESRRLGFAKMRLTIL